MSLAKYASKAEQQAVTALVDEILRRGYLVSVHEGGDWAIQRSTDREAILEACASTGHDVVYAMEPIGTEYRCKAAFNVIYQNATERDEVVYDYSGRETADAIFAVACGRKIAA